MLVAEIRDPLAGHPLHHEIRPSRDGGTRIEHPRDAGMVHHRQRLPLHFEAPDDLPVVQPHPDQLEGDLPFHRSFLLRQIDHAAPSRSEAADQAVFADPQADVDHFRGAGNLFAPIIRLTRFEWREVEKARGVFA